MRYGIKIEAGSGVAVMVVEISNNWDTFDERMELMQQKIRHCSTPLCMGHVSRFCTYVHM